MASLMAVDGTGKWFPLWSHRMRVDLIISGPSGSEQHPRGRELSIQRKTFGKSIPYADATRRKPSRAL